MLKNLSVPGRDVEENLPCIKVLGVGGAGGNAVDNMIASGMTGVEFLICNTDAQALLKSICEYRLQLGEEVTKGLGAGCSPDIGRQAAEENEDEIRAYLQDAQMVFLAAGMGGGTGTGSGPVIARIAKELGILTVAIVTTPFLFEGKQRRRVAEKGVKELEAIVDTISVVNNQNLFCISSDSTKIQEAFATADEVLASSVRSITDLVTRPGVINRDFADVRSVMAKGGRALISTVETEGEDRAERAAEAVVINPLLEKVDIATAQKLLIQVVGSEDLKLFEVQEIVDRIEEAVEGEPSVAFGYSLDKDLKGRLRVSVVATGIENPDQDRESHSIDEKNAHRNVDRAAMWYDTHQRSRRKEPEQGAEAENNGASENLNSSRTDNEEALGEVGEVGAALGETRQNAGKDTVAGGLRGNGQFRSELQQRMTSKPMTQPIAQAIVQSRGGQSRGQSMEQSMTQPLGQPLGQAHNSSGKNLASKNSNIEASKNNYKQSYKNNEKTLRQNLQENTHGNLQGKNSNRNVGLKQSVLEAMKSFVGIKNESLPPDSPVYLPRYESDTTSLPFDQTAEESPGFHVAKQKPNGEGAGQAALDANGSQNIPIPAFLRRQRD